MHNVFFIYVKEIFLVFHQTYQSNWRRPPSTYEDRNLLIYVVSGTAECTVNGVPYSYQKGDVLWLRTGDIYSAYVKELPWEYIAIYFTLYQEFDSSAFTDVWNPVFRLNDSRRLKILFHNAKRLYIQKKFGYLIEIDIQLRTILSLLIQERKQELEQKNTPSLLQPAMDFIFANYLKQTITVKELSKLCHVSSRHFSRLFLEKYQTSPIEFIQNLKLQRAKNLLESTTLSISEIAMQTGFSDIFYFSKLFKKVEGLSPSQYRKLFHKRTIKRKK